MIAILVATLGLLVLLLYSEWSSRRDRRAAATELTRSRAETAAARAELATELTRSRAETAAARAELAEERERAARERRELYQRIQAPETAVHDAALEARRGRPYVRREPIGADNDAAFMRQRGETEQAAERTADRG